MSDTETLEPIDASYVSVSASTDDSTDVETDADLVTLEPGSDTLFQSTYTDDAETITLGDTIQPETTTSAPASSGSGSSSKTWLIIVFLIFAAILALMFKMKLGPFKR